MCRGSLIVLTILIALPQITAARVPLERVDEWDKAYDAWFRKYTKRYFGPNFDWRWFKSQGIAESGLDPDATSKAGARGLMQIMPNTFKEIRKQNAHFHATNEPRWNIAAGIYYDRQLYNKWKTPPAGTERLLFSFGSYNAGYGNIVKAFKRAPDKTGSWHKIRRYVPPQTQHYVSRIQNLMSTTPEPGASPEH